MIRDQDAFIERIALLHNPQSLGHVGVSDMVALTVERVPLPLGFTYAHPKSVKSRELRALWRQVDPEVDMHRNYFARRKAVNKPDGITFTDVAVRTELDELAGFASLAQKTGSATGIMCDLIVSPACQGQGLGKALILERMRLADEAGVESLCVLNVRDTNTLSPFYAQLGFYDMGDGDLGFGPQPDAF